MLLGNTTGRPVTFRLPGSYRLRPTFPCRSARCWFCNSLKGPAPLLVGPTTPARQPRRGITPHRFRLIPVRSPLLRESRLLSLPRPTEMYQFERFPPQALWIQTWVTGHDPGRVSPFGHPRISALLAAPRGFSQPHASFIGSWRQGIHRGPFVTWPRCSRSLSSSQGPHEAAILRTVRSVRRARTLRTEQRAASVDPLGPGSLAGPQTASGRSADGIASDQPGAWLVRGREPIPARGRAGVANAP